MDILKGWKTVGINGLVILAGIIAYLDQSMLASILPGNMAWLPIVIGAANIGLRFVTTSPIGKRL